MPYFFFFEHREDSCKSHTNLKTKRSFFLPGTKTKVIADSRKYYVCREWESLKEAEAYSFPGHFIDLPILCYLCFQKTPVPHCARYLLSFCFKWRGSFPFYNHWLATSYVTCIVVCIGYQDALLVPGRTPTICFHSFPVTAAFLFCWDCLTLWKLSIQYCLFTLCTFFLPGTTTKGTFPFWTVSLALVKKLGLFAQSYHETLCTEFTTQCYTKRSPFLDIEFWVR